jgi:hypothetical protein
MKRLIFFVPLLYGALYGENLIPYRKGDKWGFSTEDKKIVVPPKYDRVWPLYQDENVTLVMLKGKYGMIDRKGNEVVKPVYDEIKWFSESFLMVKLKDKYGLIRRDNFREVVKPKYSNIEPLAKFGRYSFSFYFGVGCVEQKSENFLKVYIRNKVGLIDTTGKEVVPVKYEDVEVVLGEKTLVKFKEKEKWGIMDLSANVILPAKYDWVCYNEGKVIFAVLDNKPYAFDASGKEMQYEFESEKEEQSESYEFQYEVRSEEGDEYSEDYGDFSIVSRAGKKGVVSKDGKVIIPIAYDEIRYDERNEIFFIAKGNKWGLANKKGKILVPLKYDYITTFCKGLIAVKYNDKFGLMDKTGRIIVPPKYDILGLVKEKEEYEEYEVIAINEREGGIYYSNVYIDYVSEIKYLEYYCGNLFLVGKEGYKFGLIDEKGREVLRTEFDWVVPYKDLILVRKGDKWGIFDIRGKTVTEVLRTEFDEVVPYEDLILARKGDKWGIFDLKGKTLLPIKYDWISFEDIKEGREFVRIKENYEAGLVDRKGNIVIPPKYDDIKIVIGNKVVFQIEAYVGIADINGREILPAEYEDFRIFNENLFLMSKDLKWGLFDAEKARFVLPVKYDEINYNEDLGLFFVSRDGKDFYLKVFPDGKVIEYFDP